MLINSRKNLGFNITAGPSLLVIFFLLFSVPGKSQIDIKRYTTATDTFYWKKYIHIPKPPRTNLRRFSVARASGIVDAFTATHAGEFPQFTNDSVPRHSLKDLKKCLFPVDINADDLPDMIFSGYSGGASDIVRVWLNRRDSFELVFEDYQYISGFRKAGGKLVELQIGDPGSGDDYLYFTRQYSVTWNKSNPVFVKGKQTVAYQYTEEPLKLYPQPIPFTSKADTMLVRASAAQLNEPFNPRLDTFGNILAKYRSKSRGIVLAYKSNEKGNDWFFVEISPFSAPSASILYGIDKIPTFIRGWVSSQSIQLTP